MAGSGTKANALLTILYNLIKRSEPRRILLDEIDSFYKEQAIKDDLAPAEVQNLPYL